MGIDNDELVCNLSNPPLSSIKLGFEKAGYEAADTLDKQMKGREPIVNIVAKVQDLFERQSSDIIAIDDENIRGALVFIRRNFQKPIQVRNVVDATNLSRRTLELRFKDSLKRSINDEINKQRIRHIKRRLVNSNVHISEIAKSLEYTDTEHFSRFFKKLTSMSPKGYRHKYGNV
ncbi:helix-turn-helix domain-containing protein [Planctomycetota bacterium]